MIFPEEGVLVGAENVIEKLEYFYMKIIKELPKELKFIQDDIFIAGGSIVSLLQNSEIQDIDIYFKTEDIKNKFESLIKINKSFKKMINCYEIQFNSLGYKIQFVTKITGNPEKVIESFDFLHCKTFYDPFYNKIEFGKNQGKYSPESCIQIKILVLTDHCLFPIKAMERMIKFIERGYKPEPNLFLNFALKINTLDFSSEEKLKEHLNGLYGFSKMNVKDIHKKLHSKKFNNKMDNILNESN